MEVAVNWGVIHMTNTRTAQRSGLPRRIKILFALIFILFSILSYRTYKYFGQLAIETDQAVLKSGPGVEYKQLTQLKKNQRVTVIRQKYHWMYVKTDNDKEGWIADWMINDSYKLPINSLSNATIVIDPGHGGYDSGAMSSTNKEEKQYTLAYAKLLAQKLRKQKAKVYLTRNTDTFVSLSKRPALANNVHADAFISFHFDSSPVENTASGFTTYYYHKNSLKLAKAINNEFAAIGLDNRGVEYGNYLVIRDIDTPAVLLEMGYINSDRDFDQIKSPSYRQTVVDDVYQGLDKYFSAQKTTNN